ncbi:MAG: DNA-processing protein DprA [Fimbriimonadales bacterium]
MRKPDFWQALLSLDLSAEKSRELLDRLGPSCITAHDLLASPALSGSDRKKLSEQKSLSAQQASLLNPISIEEAAFPENLRATQNPPVALVVAGELLPSDTVAVAIVGTRKASGYGRSIARKLASELAKSGITIVSGAAFGIDAEAHKGALEAGGRTIAVMGSGLDKPYPASHRGLLNQIARSGAVVTQFALGTKPDWYRFPNRNYLIAGLSRAVIVVEAPEKSGALLTANLAGEEGRHVFVTPAQMGNAAYLGGFRLINDGATLLYSVDQVFEALGVERVAEPKKAARLSLTQRLILEKLTAEPELADNLSERLDQPAGIILAELTGLEIEGLVAKSGGGYVKV